MPLSTADQQGGPPAPVKGILHRGLPCLAGGTQRYWSLGVGRREAPREISKHGNYFRLNDEKPASKAAILNLPGGISFGGTMELLGIPYQPCSPLTDPPLFDGLLGLPFLPHILVEGGGVQRGQGLSKQQERGRYFEHLDVDLNQT